MKGIRYALLVVLSAAVAIVAAEGVLRRMGKVPGHVPRYPERQFKYVERLEVIQPFFTDEDGIFKAVLGHPWNAGYEINDDGFRSRPLVRVETNVPTVLILGDSFAWGASAQPLTESFADRLAARGFVVYNTGIPGTAPNQYAAIAGKHVPALRPDVVAVMLCLVNDFVPASPLIPGRNLHHITNAGWLSAFDESGHWMTADEAYDRYMARNNLAYGYLQDRGISAKSRVRRAFMKSVVGTYAWVRAARAWHGAKPEVTQPPDYEGVREDLARIREACRESGARFVLFAIPAPPAFKELVRRQPEDLAAVADFDPRVPADLTAADYTPPPGQHFNNAGHAKFAEFVERTLKDIP